MRIAQVPPLTESVPPRRYGGTERVVSWLTEELVRLGHDVTLFASGDSRTAARLRKITPRSLRAIGGHEAADIYEIIQIDEVLAEADRFDVIHFHTSLHYPATRGLRAAHLTTLHGPIRAPWWRTLFDQFPREALVSISDAQRAGAPDANWLATIYHGMPRDLLRFHPAPDGYFAFVGRISPEKRVDRAIRIARAVGVPLKVAAKVDNHDREYYESEIKPLIAESNGDVEFVGEVGDTDKDEFMGNARALLFPIDWPEPFGLVMIEAMACGTPVIAWSNGSVPEVMRDGQTGFIVDSMDEAIAAARRIDQIDRRACRAAFEARFTADRMAADYLRVYEALVAQRSRRAIQQEVQRAADSTVHGIRGGGQVIPAGAAAVRAQGR